MEQLTQLSKYNLFYFVCGIWIIGLSFRLFYFDETIPLILDGLSFFTYSADISGIGKLPETYDIAKPGWSYFLAVFFSIFNFEHTMQYMQLQKLLAISISSLTVFPLFFLIKKFSQTKYALLGVLIFSVEPRIIQNSLSGNAESIFILLLVSSILLFLNKNNKIIYLSFLLTGIAAIIRPEGLFLLIGISISYFIKFRKSRFVIPKYILGLLIFFLILTPVVLHKEQEGMYDTVFQRAYYTLFDNIDYDEKSRETINIQFQEEDLSTKNNNTIISTMEYFSKYLVWVLIPLFILVAPIGFIIFFKKFNVDKLTIIILSIVMAIPAVYAYTFPLLEIKYLYFLFPMFCIFATFSFKWFIEKFENKNFIFITCFILIISTSILFTDYKFEYEKEHELAVISNYIEKNTKIINSHYPESRFLLGSGFEPKWNDYQIFAKNTNGDLGNINSIDTKNPNGYNNLELFLAKTGKDDITHLVLDGKNTRPEFLNDIFYNEDKYTYLTKIYDSKDQNFEYHVKIFQVN